jgi:hypothetical protein
MKLVMDSFVLSIEGRRYAGDLHEGGGSGCQAGGAALGSAEQRKADLLIHQKRGCQASSKEQG